MKLVYVVEDSYIDIYVLDRRLKEKGFIGIFFQRYNDLSIMMDVLPPTAIILDWVSTAIQEEERAALIKKCATSNVPCCVHSLKEGIILPESIPRIGKDIFSSKKLFEWLDSI